MSAPLPSRLSRRFSALSNAVARTLREFAPGTPSTDRLGGRRPGAGVIHTEILEPRRLLTTLVGGDSFEYSSPDPANPTQFITQRIVLTGNITAELIGGTIDPLSGGVLISDVPGAFNRSEIRGLGGFRNDPTADVLGGVGGGGGVESVAPLTTGMNINSNPPFNQQGQVNWNGGSAGFNMRNFAVAADGLYYGVNVVKIGTQGTAGEQSIVQLVRISADGRNANVIAELNSRISVTTPNSNFTDANGVDAITASAFDPVSGRFFFVVHGNNFGAFTPPSGTAPTPLATQQLFSLAVSSTSTPAQILASVQAVQGSFGRTATSDTVVNALAFDQIGDTSRAVGFIVTTNGGQIFDVNLGNTNNINGILVTNGQLDANNQRVILTSVTGLGFVSDNPNARDNLVYAVESAAAGTALGTTAPVLANTTVGPQVLLINRTSGLAQQLGALPNTATPVTGTVTLGLDIQSLAFDPSRRNPFTGQRGVLLGIDNTSDQLTFIDSRNRQPNVSAFAIYVSSSDSTASIVVGQVPDFDPDDANEDRPMQPFTGNAGTLRINSASGAGIIDLTGPTGVGGVFLGLRTSGNANANQNNLPVISGTLATALGVRSAGEVTAGVYTSPSLLSSLTNQGNLSDRLIGNNVSDVTGIVVNNSGQVFVVDSDGINVDGSPVAGDQLYQIDRNTGLAIGAPLNIVDATSAAVPLANSRGITLTDNPERILAIFLQQVANAPDSQVDNQNALPGSLNLATENAQALSLSISGPGPTGFILAETPTSKILYSFSRVGTGDVTFTRLGPIVDADGNTIAAARALGVNSAGQVFTVGYPQGNPVPSQNVGGTTLNLANVSPQNLTYASDGNIYLLGFSAGSLTIQAVQRNLAGPNQGSVTGLGPASIINTAGSSVQGLSDLTSDPAGGNGLIGIGSSALSLLPTRNVGNMTDSNSASNFVYRGLTRLGREQVFALTFNGSTLNLRNVGLTGTTQLTTLDRTFNIIPGTPRTNPDNIPGNDIRLDANPASGRGATTAVLGVQATARRPGDASGIYAVGYGADALIPTGVVGGLGDVNVRQISMSRFSPTFNFPDATYSVTIPAGSTVTYGFTNFSRATRDTATGGILSGGGASYTVQVVGQNPPPPNNPTTRIAQAGGTPAVELPFVTPPFQTPAAPAPGGLATVANGIVDTRANATNKLGTNGYFTTGFNIDSPVPAAPIPGNLGGFFGVDQASGESNFRAMTFAEPVPGGLEDAYSVYFNGNGTDVYRMQRSAATGAITSFSKISGAQDFVGGTTGLRDPFNLDTLGNPSLINFVYSIWRNPAVANQYFLMGSPQSQVGAQQFLYTLTISGNNLSVDAAVQLLDQDGPFAGMMPPGPVASRVGKAGAVNAAGQVFVVIDGDFGAPGIDNTLVANSPMYLVDPATGLMTFFGNVGANTFAAALPAALDPTAVPPAEPGDFSVENSDIRAMQFHIDTNGNELLVLLDRGTNTDNGPRLIEMDFANSLRDATIPAVAPGGVPSSMAGVPTPPAPDDFTPAAVGLQSSLTGIIEDNMTSFAMDQYGRGYAFRAGSSSANPDRIIVSPNELFFQEPAPASVDGDLWSGESVRIGWLVNDDGTAFLDSVTTMAADLRGQRMIAVTRNILDSSLKPNDPNENLDRLVSFSVPGGTVTPTFNANGGGNRNLITVTPVRRTTSPTDTGLITINGAAGTAGVASNIQGLGFDVEGSLIGLDVTTTNGGRLVGFSTDPTATTTSVITGNPTFNTFTLTDQNSTPFGSTDPRGLSTDVYGRVYSVDGTTVGAPTGTNLLVSSNAVSLFRIDSTTGVATRFLTLQDGAETLSQPILSRFGGFAFQDADTAFLVQKEARSTATLVTDLSGTIVGIDRLVTFDVPVSASTTPVSFNRVNPQTGGAIQIGNSVPPPGTSNGIPTGITAMDFSSNGQLIGLDNDFKLDLTTTPITILPPANRLVSIDINPNNALAPTNSSYVSDPDSAAGLDGLTAFNTQFASIQTLNNPDTLRFSNNDQSLFAIDPTTGAATSRGNIIVTATGTTITDELPATALATNPVTGLIFAILRGLDNTNNPVDFLFTINAATGAATQIGQVRLVRDADGNAQTAASTRIINLEFSGERDNAGLPILLGVNDTGSGRQLIRVNYTNIGQSEVVRGSQPGDVPVNQVGFASDVNDGDPARVPPTNRGRFYSLDVTVPQGSTIQVTPTQIYQFSSQLTLPPNTTYRAGTNAAFGTVASLQGPNNLPILDTIRALEFNSSGSLFGVRETATGSSSFVTFPTLPASGQSPTPLLGLGNGQQIVVASSSGVALPGFPVPTGIAAPQNALVQSMFFLANGTLRAVDISQGQPRLIDINLTTPSFSVARTNAGVPDAPLVGGDVLTIADPASSVSFYLDTTNPAAVVILPDTNGDGAIVSTTTPGGGGGGGGGSALGVPVLGEVNPTTGVFTPVNNSNSGRLDASITDVLAIAFDKVGNSGRTSAGLFIVDQSNRLLQINPATGEILRVVGVVRDAFSGAVLSIGSLAFDQNGRLLGQDVNNARLVDISTVTAIAGALVATPSGSLPPTVGAIAFDPAGNRFLGVDNATGINLGAVGFETSSQLKQFSATSSQNFGTINSDIGSITIGGTVAGGVNIGGSIGRFYAGWIITGTARGLLMGTANPTPSNFRVSGDLGELITLAPIGTAGLAADPNNSQYRTGTDISVGGRIGTIFSGGDILATTRATNGRVPTTIGINQSEVETKFIADNETQAEAIGRSFTAGQLFNAAFNNDTSATAQRLRFGSNPDGSPAGAVNVTGVLDTDDGDVVDFYALPLLGGQSFNLSLGGGVGVGVFDPDGRLIMTNYTFRSNSGGSTNGGTYRIDADRPGEYRIVISRLGDLNFDGVATPGEPAINNGLAAYGFAVTGVGDLGISAVTAVGTIYDADRSITGSNFGFSAIYTATGDIGGVAAGAISSNDSSAVNTIRADGTGSIRSVSAGSIGLVRNGSLVGGLSYAAGGTVGLIQSTTGILLLNTNIFPSLAGTGTANFNPEISRVGGSVQVISANTLFFGNVLANRGLGNLRAGSMATTTPSYINVNADNVGNDGIVDLIDVAGDLGTNSAGGPAIFTNTGGNVRYMRAGGNVFRDAIFGGGAGTDIFLDPGTTLNFIDDSGARIDISFDERFFVLNPLFDPNIPGSQRFSSAPQIGYLPYPVRSGGAVMMILQITGLGTDAAFGINDPTVTFNTTGNTSAEVSLLVLRGDSSAVTTIDGELGQLGTALSDGGRRITVNIGGPSRLDILSLNTNDATTHIHNFKNFTRGELLDLNANTFGTLSYHGDLGISRPGINAVPVIPIVRTADVYPFELQQNALRFDSHVIRIESGGALGNILVGGNAGTVQANNGGVNDPSSFEGIAGPLVFLGAFVNQVGFGEGVASAGTGRVAGGVVFATGVIGQISGSGDIRGSIVSSSGIGTVSASGAIVNALIGVLSTQNILGSAFLGFSPNYGTATRIIPRFNNNINSPVFTIGTLRSGAGIIGTEISANDINTISVSGFGMVNSIINAAGSGVLAIVSAAGYGLRGVTIDGYARVGRISATGNGSNLSTNNVTSAVRQSEFTTIDPASGEPLTAANDIHRFLTTSAATPIIDGVTTTGVIEDINLGISNNLNTINAFSIRGSNPGTVNSELFVGGRIGTLTTRSVINGLTIRTGGINTFAPGSDVLNLDMSVAGSLRTLNIKGSLASNSHIELNGPSASLGSMTVKGNFDGTIDVKGKVSSINIGGNLTSSDPTRSAISIQPRPGSTGNALGRLTVGGSIVGNVTILGSVGTITVPGSFGVAGNTFTITGNLSTLNVGTSGRLPPGRLMAMNVTVGGTIGTISVRGRMTGAVTSTGSIRTINVRSDGDANRSLIAGNITSTAGNIQTVTVTGGDIDANLTAFNNLSTVNVSGGSVGGAATLSTVAGAVGNITVKKGNYLGSITSGDAATTGLKSIGNVNIDGDLGNGSTAYAIRGSSLRLLKVKGSIFSSSNVATDEVNISGTISQLNVGRDVNAGVTIRAGAISKQQIGGQVFGEIIVG